jgi:hypothetical protein
MNTKRLAKPFEFALASRTRIALLLVAVTAIVFATGCNRGPAMSQVSGKVLLKDGSVPKGGVRVVRFQPADSTAEIRKGASGAIEDDGSFTMWTKQPGDGVYHGNYIVTIAVLKGTMDTTPMISPKFVSPQTSPFKVTVDGDINDLKFEVDPVGAPQG